MDEPTEEEIKVDAETVVLPRPNYIAEILENTPEVRFRHPKVFSDDEDKIIAAGLASRTALYRIAESIHCSRSLLVKHIEADPCLSQIRADSLDKEMDQVDEALDDLVRLRCASAVIWKAEKLMRQKYGAAGMANQEDDTRIVIGQIPDDDIQSADEILANANGAPHEVGVSALLTHDSNVQHGCGAADGVGGVAQDTPPSVNEPANNVPRVDVQNDGVEYSDDDFVDDGAYDSRSWMS